MANREWRMASGEYLDHRPGSQPACRCGLCFRSRRDFHPHGHTVADGYTDAHAHPDRHTHFNPNGYPYPYAYLYARPHTDLYPHCHTRPADRHTYFYLYFHRYTRSTCCYVCPYVHAHTCLAHGYARTTD